MDVMACCAPPLNLPRAIVAELLAQLCALCAGLCSAGVSPSVLRLAVVESATKELSAGHVCGEYLRDARPGGMSRFAACAAGGSRVCRVPCPAGRDGRVLRVFDHCEYVCGGDHFPLSAKRWLCLCRGKYNGRAGGHGDCRGKSSMDERMGGCFMFDIINVLLWIH